MVWINEKRACEILGITSEQLSELIKRGKINTFCISEDFENYKFALEQILEELKYEKLRFKSYV